MTYYEFLTLLIALLAVVISAVSFVRSGKTQERQLEFEAINATLAKKQLEIILREDTMQGKAHLVVELVKVGKTDFRFVIRNQSSVIATNVDFIIDKNSSNNPLVKNECQGKLPYPYLQPGQFFTLIAALYLGSAMNCDTLLTWTNPDGSQDNNRVHIST